MVVILVGVAVGALAIGTAFAASQLQAGRQGKPSVEHLILPRLTEATGLSREDMLKAFVDGATPAELALENGVDPEAFVADLLTEIETNLAEAVAEGKIDDEQAGQALAQTSQEIPAAMNNPVQLQIDFFPHNDRQDKPNPVRAFLGAVVEATGLTQEELRTELEAGKTPAEIITESGGDPAAVGQQLLADTEARLAEAVANGNLEQEQADDMLANAAAKLEELMNKVFEFPPQGEGPGRGPGGGPGTGI